MSADEGIEGEGVPGPSDAELMEALGAEERVQASASFASGLRAAFLAGFPEESLVARGNPYDAYESRSRRDPRLRSQLGEELTSLPAGRPAESPEASKASKPASIDPDSVLDREHSSDNPSDSGSDELEARLARELANQPLCEHEPQPRFREDLRRCFLTGRFPQSADSAAEGELEGSAGAPGPLPHTSPERVRRRGRDFADARARSRRSRLRIVRGVLVAAAAVLILAVLLPRDPEWTLQLIEGDGLLVVDGYEELVSVEDFQGNMDAFLTAGLIQTRSNRIELTLPGELLIELTPETWVDAAGLEARPRDGKWRMRIDQGEAFIQKAKATRGRPLLIQTYDAEVEVLGTTLGVMCNSDLTCICVSEGQVEVHPVVGSVASAKAVTGGNSLLVMRRGEDVLVPMPFPQTLCPSTQPHKHHVCALVGFQARASVAR